MDNNIERILAGYTRKNCDAVYKAMLAIKNLEEFNSQFTDLNGQSLAESTEIVAEDANSVVPITGVELNEAYAALMSVLTVCVPALETITSAQETAIRKLNLRG